MGEKKSGAGLIIGIVAVVVAIFATAAGIIVSTVCMNPKRQLAKGVANMAEEMKAYTTRISDDIDFKALAEAGMALPVHSNMDLSFTSPEAEGGINNISIGLDSVTDVKNRQGKADIKAGAYGITLELGSLIADNNKLYLVSRQFLKGDVYSIDLGNFGRDFKNSVWAKYMDVEIPEDVSITLFDSGKYDEAAAHNKELADIFKKNFTELSSSVKYGKIKEKREFSGAGGTVSYGGVQVTIEKGAYNAAMENLKNDILASSFYAQYLEWYQKQYPDALKKWEDPAGEAVSIFTAMKAEGDIVLDFYMDIKGRIRCIATPENMPVSIKDSEINAVSASIDFAGGARALDSVEGGICYYTEADGQVLEIGIARAASVTEDSYDEDLTLRLGNNIDESIIFSYINKWTYEDKSYDMTVMLDYAESALRLSAKGGYEDIEKGKGYTLRLDNATFNVDTEDKLIASGTISLETAENSKIEVPQNDIDVLKMSEMDIMSAVMKASAAFENFQ